LQSHRQPCSGPDLESLLDRMKIALVYNPASGRHVALESLRALLTAGGHDVIRALEHSSSLDGLADPPAELVVAAGGDGTVADAVRAVAGRGVPMALLPLGTANNIASTLGVQGRLEPLVQSWHQIAAQPFDLGVLQAPGGPRRFVEGTGGGLVAASLASFQRRPLRRGEPPPAQLVGALRRYSQTLKQLRPQRWSLRIDGRAVDGEFLLVEVLNTRAVGPNLELAPESNPFDGALTVVTAREQDRGALADYIADRLAGLDTRLTLDEQSALCVEIDHAPTLHLDDELLRLPVGTGVSIRVQAAAVSVLA
jgi:diacylglycerol kinase family enzyme